MRYRRIIASYSISSRFCFRYTGDNDVMKKLFLFALAPVTAVLAWQQSARVKLPPPFHTESSTNRPQVISRPGGAQLQLPAGFQIDDFATGFQRPRIMLYGPSGEIL